MTCGVNCAWKNTVPLRSPRGIARATEIMFLASFLSSFINLEQRLAENKLTQAAQQLEGAFDRSPWGVQWPYLKTNWTLAKPPEFWEALPQHRKHKSSSSGPANWPFPTEKSISINSNNLYAKTRPMSLHCLGYLCSLLILRFWDENHDILDWPCLCPWNTIIITWLLVMLSVEMVSVGGILQCLS